MSCEIWNYDDLTSCSRTEYLNKGFPLVLLLIILFYLSYCFYRTKHFGKIRLASSEDALFCTSDEYDHQISHDSEGMKVSQLSSFELDDQEFEISDDFDGVNQSNTNNKKSIQDRHYDITMKLPTWTGSKQDQSLIIIVRRKIIDNLRTVVEFIMNSTQFILHCYYLNKIGRLTNSSETELKINGMGINIILWFVLTIIVLLRLINTNQSFSFISNRLGNLWGISFFSYLILFMTHIPTYRTTFLSNELPEVDSEYYKQQFYLIGTLFVGLLTSPIKNSSPILFKNTHDTIASPEPTTSILGKISFSWLSPLIWSSHKHPLAANKVWGLIQDDYSVNVIRKFRVLKEKSTIPSSFSGLLLKYFGKDICLQIIWAIISSICCFIPTFFLQKILEYVDSPKPDSESLAWFYVSSMLVAKVLVSICQGQVSFIGRRISVRMRSIVISEIYEKSLKKTLSSANFSFKNDEDVTTSSNEEERILDDGYIINLMASDATKVGELSTYLHAVIEALVMTSIAITFLYKLLGGAALVGTGIIVALMPFNIFLTKLIAKFQGESLKFTDKRIQKLNEVFGSIRIVKSFVWEDDIIKKIMDLRCAEVAILKKNSFLWSFNATIWYASPTVITSLSFIYYIFVGKNTLTIPIAFTSLALFGLLKTPLDQLSNSVNFLAQSKVSLDRIEQFLSIADTKKFENLTIDDINPRLALENATLGWDVSGKGFQLNNINVEFEIGKLNLIIGPTGSGKTSLLMGLLGELHLHSGKVFVPSLSSKYELTPDESNFINSISFCSQSAWILNDTVRNNIIFDSIYDSERYKEVIHACGLERDLEILKYGDNTLVGDRGSCLSGGQKQRISLARAVYSNSRHLILDDCLSAVDAHSAKWIYTLCLNGPLMTGRTCILVSHNVSLTFWKASKVVLIENATILAVGKPEDLFKKGFFPELNDIDFNVEEQFSYLQTETSLKEEIVGQTPFKGAETNTMDKGSQLEISEYIIRDNDETSSILIEKTDDTEEHNNIMEFKSTGSVGMEVYKWFFKNYGLKTFLMVCFSFLFAQSVYVTQSWWVRYWLNDQTPNENSMSINEKDHLYYIRIYILIGFSHAVISGLKSTFSFICGVNTSNKIFEKVLTRVIKSKLHFFDTTPLGRIMNRFSKDIQSLDNELTPFIDGLFSCLIQAAGALVIIICITPGFLSVAIFIFCASLIIGYFYLCCSRELKRYESISKSPIYQHFTETLHGVVTIRAYGNEIKFLKENISYMDENNKFYFYMFNVNNWLSFRIDLLGALTIFGAGAFILLNVENIDTGMAGISLSYAVTFTEFCIWMIKFYATVEMNMNSVERLKEYMDIDEEPLDIIPEQDLSNSWPSSGSISFKNYSLRYAPELPTVLKNLSFKIEGESRIGIVGRTGAGKSSIISALFRFLESSSGKIEIDGVDIAKIDLKTLRTSLTIVPQDPTLFAGSIRSNLDPYNQYTDLLIYDSLLKMHLITKEELLSMQNGEDSHSSSVSNFFLDLSNEICEGGKNLSLGQRQLLCLTRSILNSSKIILLDEATASIDYKTDALIQKSIREDFSDKTILTIAHRIKSVIDYDKILVLDAGELKEYDHPWLLLQNKSSIFYSMCEQSGELDLMLQLSKASFESS